MKSLDELASLASNRNYLTTVRLKNVIFLDILDIFAKIHFKEFVHKTNVLNLETLLQWS